MTMAEHLEQGRTAESSALKYLESRGLRLVARNYRSSGGEIDLIMQQNDSLVFIEVRYRKSSRFGTAVESVTPSKQRKLLLTAGHYLQEKGSQAPCRFDVVGISGKNQTEIEWIQDAFQANC
ncbi:MAG: YraN family protein [Candidatus Thiodiazotropha sp. (ex Notomyrtea botanica)]|nr:YraN family protein [Candidatus Thiodiazotropha sp. (ex Notomyrtea botanica)]